MNRRRLLVGIAALAIPAGAAHAADFVGRIVDQLRAQGYRDIDVRRTLLGRVQIRAVSARHRREIIVNPRSGEILRDYWESKDGGEDHGRILDPEDDDNSGGGSGDAGSGGGGSDDGGSGDDGDDDDGEDDDDDDGGDDSGDSDGGEDAED